MSNYLQGQRVNLQLLQDSQCRELFQLLEKVPGNKIIVLDNELKRLVNLVVQPTFFSEKNIKLWNLEDRSTTIPKKPNNIIYFARPQIELMELIADHILNCRDDRQIYHVFFIPRRCCLCIKHLELKGVYGKIDSTEELPWNFFPIDIDVISMENTSFYRDIMINEDPTPLYQSAKGLVQLQRIYGRMPKIYGKGNMAHSIWERAKQFGSEGKVFHNGEKGVIDQIILLDRSIDLLSGLATQLTYEGLIDELYSIKQNIANVPTELFTSKNENNATMPQQKNSKKHIVLNSSDKLYSVLRNKNFNEVGKILARNAREISAQINTSGQDKSVQEMKHLVDKLPELLAQKKSVTIHTALAENIRKYLDTYEFTDDLAAEQEFLMCEDIDKPSAYIENLIAKKCNLINILRLMSIQCVAASGFKEKVLNHYKRELIHVYGLDVLLNISNLEKAGLLYGQLDSRVYAVVRKTLNLTVEDVVEIEPKDISYVHSFYAPLTARIVEHSLKPLGWQSLKHQISNLPGPTFEDFQTQLIGIGGRHNIITSEGSSLNIPRVVLVFFVGGCTFAEIAALRFLSTLEDNNVEFVIATTKLISKNSFLESLI